MPYLSVDQIFQIAVRHHESGDVAKAEALYKQILSAQPDHADALHLLGVIARQFKRPQQAVELISRSIALKPNLADAHSNLGAALQDCGRLDEAIAADQRAIQLNPNLAEAYNNLGSAFQQKRLLDEAITAYQTALSLAPGIAELHHNLAIALQEKRQLPQALAALNRAIEIKPDYALAHYALAQLLLLLGDFQNAWKEWEWRLIAPTYQSLLHNENFSQPRWDGSPLKGRTLLIHCEAGFGDTFQFIRYINFAAAQGGYLILRCPPKLRRLLKCVTGVERLLVWSDPLPPFDVYCPMMSLPAIVNTTLQNIPALVPYLHAESLDVERWREKLTPDRASLKIGLTWAGGPDPKDRSLPLAALAPLSAVHHVTFYSLQTGPAVNELLRTPPGLHIVDTAQDLNDFADTAALIANLDLVISVDTAVLHLAGAMGKPAWGLLKFMADCRWMLDRTDSPWYPTLHLFRQPSPGDWQSVVSVIVKRLTIMTMSRDTMQ